MELLVISNGHGEDAIAIRIIQALQKISPDARVWGLAMVGEGFAYGQAHIPLIARVKSMPSGGFIYMDKKHLWQDIRQGLLALIISQYRATRKWVQKHPGGIILAVGDILPLLFAWLSGAKYYFVGTAKSEYYLKDEEGWLEETPCWERWFDSVYYPWERCLLKHPRCMGAFPRDSFTASSLRRYGIRVYDCGNPMMDGLDTTIPHYDDNLLKILLLPGSRFPESLHNWRLILLAIDSLLPDFPVDLLFVAAIAPYLPLKDFTDILKGFQWSEDEKTVNVPLNPDDKIVFTKRGRQLVVSQNSYTQCLQYCDMAIAMAGTATEQFVGLGKPVIAFPGRGPQYNLQFARNQRRLLGISLQLVDNPQQVREKILQLLSAPDLWEMIAANGKKRLGQGGASQKIATILCQHSDS
ncbi:MAG: lipid-A-disaccharide synthase-related protein [Geminocystis sp.]|nr:lipid-A-disaccharide synthase-related protein [Geminocystis sp.]HIK37494.1 hypothetical protein [Geminocystis sp. M7585_C2015_104]MCS7148894.1 lipid-A-disaccharide synthase-related protein [Geminocystis sp.]MCX8078664.1 lipid-A-disaccharide synthase-related protein [Geminocystis sp.]MDW8116979.1 lipid-A-disaccharide synthase-related protein [Geminocystis sp.]